jgi:glycosyltransferase involved in cell wall biosynthesis
MTAFIMTASLAHWESAGQCRLYKHRSPAYKNANKLDTVSNKLPEKPKVIVVMPARNAAKTLQATYKAIPAGCIDEVILVDNKSKDETVQIAEALGIQVVRHPSDRGYGGSLKSCLTAALEAGADLIVELHPDGQYNTELVPDLIAKAKQTGVGIVMGSRFIPAKRALEGNMPLWKFLGNRCLTFMNSVLLGTWLSEFHTGYRVYNAEMVRNIPYLNDSDDYLFSFEIIAQSVYFGYGVTEIPAFSRYYKEASSCPPWGTIKYSIGALIASLKFRLQKLRLGKFAIFQNAARAA